MMSSPPPPSIVSVAVSGSVCTPASESKSVGVSSPARVLCVRRPPSFAIVIVSFAASPVSVRAVESPVTAAFAAAGSARAAAAAAATMAAVRRTPMVR